MTSPAEVLVLAGRLAGQGRPYALVTVVNVVRPASTRRGDRALVQPDGTLAGWVGGACSEPIVVREAMRAIADGEPRLVRIAPSGTPAHGTPADAVLVDSRCASEGIVEVLVEPQLPSPLLAVVGESPAGRTLVELARTIGWRVTDELGAGADAVVVATMGHGDEDALEVALRAGTDYVGLVASARRAGTVLAALRERGADPEALARVRAPAGRDLGPSTQEEIAVAILAELVVWRHTSPAAGAELAAPAEAVDPVCAMTVTVSPATETAIHQEVAYFFCSAGCRASFEADPATYLADRTPPATGDGQLGTVRSRSSTSSSRT